MSLTLTLKVSSPEYHPSFTSQVWDLEVCIKTEVKYNKNRSLIKSKIQPKITLPRFLSSVLWPSDCIALHPWPSIVFLLLILHLVWNSTISHSVIVFHLFSNILPCHDLLLLRQHQFFISVLNLALSWAFCKLYLSRYNCIPLWHFGFISICLLNYSMHASRVCSLPYYWCWGIKTRASSCSVHST